MEEPAFPFLSPGLCATIPAVRPLALLLLLALTAHAAEPPAAPTWPPWDGQESVEQYAKRAGLEPTKTLDLGNGIKMEMVLIPAGKFTMGTEEPGAVDEESFREKIVRGQLVLSGAGGALAILLGIVAVRAIRRRQRPQFSLGYLVVMVFAAGIGVMGGTRWWEAARGLADAKTEYARALARYNAADDSEKPAHEVTLTQPFYLGRYEVTQEQYEQVMGTNPSQFKGRDLPVECVSWDAAQEFCKKASEKTGLTVRVPTGTEWEHACRAGTRTTYCTGDRETDLERAAWYGANSGRMTHPVGQKVPNAWGLYDMHGNVCEWVQDFYAPYKAEATTDPQDLAECAVRVLRGGCWCAVPIFCRSANRFRYGPDLHGIYILGFRVAADVSPKAP